MNQPAWGGKLPHAQPPDPNTNMTVEHLLESVREQWQKLGFHPNVTVTFSAHVKEVTAKIPSAAYPTIFIPLPSPSSADPTNES